MSEKEEKEVPIVYGYPPSLDAKTWAEVEKARIEVERMRSERMLRGSLSSCECFQGLLCKEGDTLALSAWVIVGGIVLGAGVPTFVGKISGETFAFLAGSVVGYVITVLSRYA